MKKTIKRLVSLLCMLCMLASVWLPLLPAAPAERAAAVPASVSREVTVTDGSRWLVTVTYDTDDGIPEGADLSVAELTERDEGYEDYLARSAQALGEKPEGIQFARALDISLRDPVTLEEYQPTGSVSVSITLMDTLLEEYGSVSVLHFGEREEVLPASVGGDTVAFETEGFSVYLVVGHEGDLNIDTPRVMFHYIGHNYSVVGDSSTLGSHFEAAPYQFLNRSAANSDGVYENDEYQTTQILRDGEALEMIANPPTKFVPRTDDQGKPVLDDTNKPIEDEVFFYGWYVVDYLGMTEDGKIQYQWPSENQLKVPNESPIQISPTENTEVNVTTVSWYLGEKTAQGIVYPGTPSGSGTLDADGCIHVYLAPLYQDFFFVNFHQGPVNGEGNLKKSLVHRKLVVFGSGNSSPVCISDVSSDGGDPRHQTFAGWQTEAMANDPYLQPEEKFFRTIDREGNQIDQNGGSGPYYITVTKPTDRDVRSYDLYPYFDDARWLIFNTGKSGNGSTYVSPRYRITNDSGSGNYLDQDILENQEHSVLSERSGYDLEGWYVNAVVDDDGEITNLSEAKEVIFYIRDDSAKASEYSYIITYEETDGNGDYNFDSSSGKYVEAPLHDGDYKIGSKTPNYVSDVFVPEDGLVQVKATLRAEKLIGTEEGHVGEVLNPTHANGNLTLESSGNMTLVKLTYSLKLPEVTDAVSKTVTLYGVKDGKLYFYKALDDLTVYANWVPQQVNYYVVHWLQNANDDNYTMIYRETKTGYVGENTEAQDLKNNEPAGSERRTAYDNHKLQYSQLKAAPSQKVISGDGSTVVNIYYDRNIYRLRFDVGFKTDNTYYVSNITNARDNGGYVGFLSTPGYTYNVGTNDPFSSGRFYTGTYTSGSSTVYYYDIVARYGQRIVDLWPASFPELKQNGNSNTTKYYFIGWIQSNQSKLYYDQTAGGKTPSSLKGAYETMSEDLILMGNGVYTATTADNGGVAHEFHCRYNNAVRNYVYRSYFWRPDLQGYDLSEPDVEFVVSGGSYTINNQPDYSGSTPRDQTVSTYTGYHIDKYFVLTENENGSESPPETTDWSKYSITLIKDPDTSYNGMVMRYYYEPNSSTIHYLYGTAGGRGGTAVGESVTRYYTQNIENLYQAKAEADVPTGYKFKGWYDNPDGSGTPYDFNKKNYPVPAENGATVILYACYEPMKYRVMVDPNGGELDHIDHKTDSNTYATGTFTDDDITEPFDPFDPFNRPAIEGERAANAGYYGTTFFNVKYGEKISEYNVSRNYVPISEAAVEDYVAQGKNIYYYVNTQYYIMGHGMHADNRNAIYLKEDMDHSVGSAEYQANSEVYKYWKFYFNWQSVYSRWSDRSYLAAHPEATEVPEEQKIPVLSFDDWRQLYVSEQKYRVASGEEQYTLLGWYEVTDMGTDHEVEAKETFDFSAPGSRVVSIRAKWRLDGGYKIVYHPDYVTPDGVQLNGFMERTLDPSDQEVYTDQAPTNIFKEPSKIIKGTGASQEETSEYIFRGFQLVAATETSPGSGQYRYKALEEGVYYDPGDDFIVHAEYATPGSNEIHFQAVYERREDSYRRPSVSTLYLDADGGFMVDGNTGAELTADQDLPQVGEVGFVRERAAVDDLVFGDLQSNLALHLYQYATDLEYPDGEDENTAEKLDPVGKIYFDHPRKFFLLGFDKQDSRGDYLADYAADSVVAVRRARQQTLYAVWEPLVYVTFVNHTEETIHFQLRATDNDDALEYINQVVSRYQRKKCSDEDVFELEPGARLTLAFPSGAYYDPDENLVQRRFSVYGTNELGPGWFLSAASTFKGTGRQSFSGVKNNEAFTLTETFEMDPEPIIITFESNQNPHTLALIDNFDGGTSQEIYFDENDNTSEFYIGNPFTVPSAHTWPLHEFLGWSFRENTDENTEPDYRTGDEIPNPAEFFAQRPDQSVVYLYGIWKDNLDAKIVYIRNLVPDPGNPSKEFTYEVGFSGEWYYSNQGSSGSGPIPEHKSSFTLKHEEYLKITTDTHGDPSGPAWLTMTVEKYDGSGTPVEEQPVVIRWDKAQNNVIIGVYNFFVTQRPVDGYDTTNERINQTTDYSLTADETYGVTWADPNVGGRVDFTNTIKTSTVTVEKNLIPNRSESNPFNFRYEYQLDAPNGPTKSGSFTAKPETPYQIENVPYGASITIKETVKSDYLTDSSSTLGENTVPGNDSITLNSVTEDRTVTFTNTLRSVPVKIELVDQTGSYPTSDPISGVFNLSWLAEHPYANADNHGLIYEGNIYVGEYNFSQQTVTDGYIGLERTVPLTISYNPDQQKYEVTADHYLVQVSTPAAPSASDPILVKVINLEYVTVNVAKVLNDDLVSQRTFTLQATYTYQNPLLSAPLTNGSAPITRYLTAYSGEDAVFESFQVPKGSSLKVWELFESGEVPYDIVVDWDSDTGISPTMTSSPTTAYVEKASVTADTTITFTNTRKKVDVTLAKVVDDSADLHEFEFTVTLKTPNNEPITNYVAGTGGTTDDYGTISPRLKGTGTDAETSVTFSVPIGAQMEFAETGVRLLPGEADGDVSLDNDYITQVEFKYTDTGSSFGGADPDPTVPRKFLVHSVPDRNMTVTYQNNSAGLDVSFKKINGFGQPLDGATFKLFKDLACTEDTPKTYEGTSGADGNDTGVVILKKVPKGVYYMKETNAEGNLPSTSDGVHWKNDKTYILLVGQTNLVAGTDELAFISQEQLNAQTGNETLKYAIFLSDENGNALPDPDIAAYGILNQAVAKRRVILRKADGNGTSAYQMLQGAHFRIFRMDLTEVKPKSGDFFQSFSSGVWFSDSLPYGKYYLLETQAPTKPDGYGGNAGNVYVLIVNESGFFDGGSIPVKRLEAMSNNMVTNHDAIQDNENDIIETFKEWFAATGHTP